MAPDRKTRCRKGLLLAFSVGVVGPVPRDAFMALCSLDDETTNESSVQSKCN